MGALKGAIGPNTVHLCIDMQLLFAPDGLWPTPWMERVLPSVIRLVERFPERTVFTRFVTPDSLGEVRGTWRSFYEKWPEALRRSLDNRQLCLIPELGRFVPPAMVLDKMAYSAFATGELAAMMTRRRADTLVVTGSETDVCVLSSVLAAVDHGYRTIVAHDAMCSSSDEAHDAAINLYRGRFEVQVELAKVVEILEAWRE